MIQRGTDMLKRFQANLLAKLNTVGKRSAAIVSAYLVFLLFHITINNILGRGMANEGLAFWQVSGTVVAAVIASIYGSSYAFELNRQKEEAALRKKDLEAGRWALVVLAVHVTYLINMTKHIYKEIKEDRAWRLTMRTIHSFDDVPKPNWSELRFLTSCGKEAVNHLITAANDSSVIDVQNVIAIRNDFKERSKAKLNAYFDQHPEELHLTNKDETQEEFVERICKAIGDPLAYQIAQLSENLLVACEQGVRNTVKLFDDLHALLEKEFTDLGFKGLDKVDMEKQLGKKLWQ